MSFRNFIDQLKSTGKLIEITHPVSPEFEAPGIAKEKGAPILFHDNDGKKAIMNLLAALQAVYSPTPSRIAITRNNNP